MYKHEDLVSGLTDLEKTSTMIPERPITYVAEPPSLEERWLDMMASNPMEKVRDILREAERQWLKANPHLERSAEDVNDLVKNDSEKTGFGHFESGLDRKV